MLNKYEKSEKNPYPIKLRELKSKLQAQAWEVPGETLHGWIMKILRWYISHGNAEDVRKCSPPAKKRIV